jgi:hypothetical protein
MSLERVAYTHMQAKRNLACTLAAIRRLIISIEVSFIVVVNGIFLMVSMQAPCWHAGHVWASN